MRSLILSLLLCLSLVTLGQQNNIGFFGGPGFSRLHSSGLFRPIDAIMNFQAGAHYTHWFKNGFGLQGQFAYTTTGGASDVIWTDDFGEEIGRDQALYRFSHIGVALGATYRTPGRLHALASLGVMPATIVRGEFYAPFDRGTMDRVVTNFTAKAGNPILFGYGSFGGAWDLTAPITIGLLFRYDHGLTTLSRPDFFENENLYGTSWTAQLTVAYRWSRKRPASSAE